MTEPTHEPTHETTSEPDETTQPGETDEYVEPTADPELPERALPVEPEPDSGGDVEDVVSTAEPS